MNEYAVIHTDGNTVIYKADSYSADRAGVMLRFYIDNQIVTSLPLYNVRSIDLLVA